jgi:TonB family protein
MPRLSVVCLALSLAARHLAAQTCAAPTDSLPAVLIAAFDVDGRPDSMRAVYAESLGAGIRAGLRVPDPLPTAAWTATPSTTVPYLSGDVSFTVNRDGTVRDVRITRSTLVGAVDTALVDAVRGLDSARASRGDRERLIMHLNLRVDQPPTGIKLVGPPTPGPGSGAIERGRSLTVVTLLRLTVPVWPHTPPPQLVRSADAESRGVSGTSLMQVVIDEKGRVIRGSERQLGVPNDRLFDGARATVEHFEFSPFTLGGCPAKATLVIPIRIQ